MIKCKQFYETEADKISNQMNEWLEERNKALEYILISFQIKSVNYTSVVYLNKIISSALVLYEEQ